MSGKRVQFNYKVAEETAKAIRAEAEARGMSAGTLLDRSFDVICKPSTTDHEILVRIEGPVVRGIQAAATLQGVDVKEFVLSVLTRYVKEELEVQATTFVGNLGSE